MGCVRVAVCYAVATRLQPGLHTRLEPATCLNCVVKLYRLGKHLKALDGVALAESVSIRASTYSVRALALSWRKRVANL